MSYRYPHKKEGGAYLHGNTDEAEEVEFEETDKDLIELVHGYCT